MGRQKLDAAEERNPDYQDRYYLIDLGANALSRQQKADTMRNAVPESIERKRPYEKWHTAASVDGRYLIAQAATSSAEHANLIRDAGVTLLGDHAEAMTYIAKNMHLWDPMLAGDREQIG